MEKLIRFFKEDDGATMPEYALMVALIAAVCIGVVTTLGLNSQTVFGNAATSMAGAS
jgi:pilus assembly protein Flp/PilA